MTCGEIVLPAEGDHAALARVAVKLELTERQFAYVREERSLLIHADQFRLVAEACGERRHGFVRAARAIKEVKLRCHSLAYTEKIASILRRSCHLRAVQDHSPVSLKQSLRLPARSMSHPDFVGC